MTEPFEATKRGEDIARSAKFSAPGLAWYARLGILLT